ncbi:transposase, partial [Paenibacillus elgii]
PVPITSFQRSFYGATYLFDQIGQETGVEADLKACFPDSYKKILSIAYFLIVEENNSLSRFSHWQRIHIHPFGADIPSQRSSELFQSIEEAQRMAFFEKQGKRRIEKEYWAFDITTLSSYSEVLKQVKKGKNKEHDRLPQINLALLFGEESGLPFYYRKLPGHVTDVKTVRQLMQEFHIMGYKKVN